MARKDVDTLLGLLGHPGRYQIMIFFLLMWQYMPFAFTCLSMILFGEKPTAVGCMDSSARNLSISQPSPASCQSKLDFRDSNAIAECSKYDSKNSDNAVGNYSAYLCSDCLWEYTFESPSEKSIISEFNLICEDYWQISLASALAFLGMMVGAPIFGWASDRYGRKPALLTACLLSLVAGLGVTFAPNYPLFLVFRFCAGFCIQGMNLCCFTLMIETFPKKYRELAGIGSQFIWSLAVMLLGAFGYLLQNWRHLQLLISLFVIIAPLYIFFVKESLRWLYVNQKFEEASVVTKSILRFNKKKHTKRVADCADYLALWYHKDHEEEDSSSTFLNIFTSPQLRKRVLGMTYIMLTASIWYYVTSFSIADFFGSKYVNLVVAGAIDVPLTVATIFIVKRFGCRWPMLYTLVFGGVFVIIAGPLPDSSKAWQITRTVMLQLSRASAHCVFNMMFPYTSDLLPTTVRAVGMGVCSSALRMGGVLAPQVLLLGTYISKEIPFILCGVMAVIGGFVTYVLPETRGVPIPETLDDLQVLGKTKYRVAMELS